MIDRIETVAQAELPVDENLVIQKHRLKPEGISETGGDRGYLSGHESFRN